MLQCSFVQSMVDAEELIEHGSVEALDEAAGIHLGSLLVIPVTYGS